MRETWIIVIYFLASNFVQFSIVIYQNIFNPTTLGIVFRYNDIPLRTAIKQIPFYILLSQLSPSQQRPAGEQYTNFYFIF